MNFGYSKINDHTYGGFFHPNDNNNTTIPSNFKIQHSAISTIPNKTLLPTPSPAVILLPTPSPIDALPSLSSQMAILTTPTANTIHAPPQLPNSRYPPPQIILPQQAVPTSKPRWSTFAHSRSELSFIPVQSRTAFLNPHWADKTAQPNLRMETKNFIKYIDLNNNKNVVNSDVSKERVKPIKKITGSNNIKENKTIVNQNNKINNVTADKPESKVNINPIINDNPVNTNNVNKVEIKIDNDLEIVRLINQILSCTYHLEMINETPKQFKQQIKLLTDFPQMVQDCEEIRNQFNHAAESWSNSVIGHMRNHNLKVIENNLNRIINLNLTVEKFTTAFELAKVWFSKNKKRTRVINVNSAFNAILNKIKCHNASSLSSINKNVISSLKTQPPLVNENVISNVCSETSLDACKSAKSNSNTANSTHDIPDLLSKSDIIALGRSTSPVVVVNKVVNKECAITAPKTCQSNRSNFTTVNIDLDHPDNEINYVIDVDDDVEIVDLFPRLNTNIRNPFFETPVNNIIFNTNIINPLTTIVCGDFFSFKPKHYFFHFYFLPKFMMFIENYRISKINKTNVLKVNPTDKLNTLECEKIFISNDTINIDVPSDFIHIQFTNLHFYSLTNMLSRSATQNKVKVVFLMIGSTETKSQIDAQIKTCDNKLKKYFNTENIFYLEDFCNTNKLNINTLLNKKYNNNFVKLNIRNGLLDMSTIVTTMSKTVNSLN